MGQITILVNYKAKHENREIFVNEVIESEILDKIKKEDGAISYEYFYNVTNSDSLLLVEKWISEEKQQQHLKTEHMKKLKAIKEKYILETDVQSFRE